MESSTKIHTGSNAIKLTFAKILTLAISMVSSMLLSRFRTLTEYGTYSQLLMVINLASSLFMLGLPNCINYFLGKAKSNEEKAKFLSNYYTLSTILSAVVGMLLVLSVPLLENYFKNEYIKVFWYFLATYPWTKVIMSSTENLLIAYNKTTIMTIYKALNSVFLLGAIIIVQITGGTFNQYMILFLVVEVSFTVWTYILAKKNALTLKLSLDRQMIRTILTFSVPIGLASMMGTINIELDKMVITSFFSTEELAIYTNASKELPVTIIATSLTAVLMPQVVKLLHNNKKRDAVNIWKSATTISFAIISFFAVMCIIFAPEIITVLYSAKYLAGVGAFRVYCVVLFLKCTYFGMMLNATGKTKFIFLSSVITIIVNFVLNFTFVHLFGFIGPAFATLAATIIMQMIQLINTSKILEISFKDIFPWKNCFLYTVINIVIGVCAYSAKCFLADKSDINTIFIAVIMGCLGLIVYVLIMAKPIKKQWSILNMKD